MDEIFAELITDYNTQIYKNYRLSLAPFEKIVHAIQQEADPTLRTRFLITDKLGRLFNAIPVSYDNDQNVLFSLTFDPSSKELFWWLPKALNSAKYVSHADLAIKRKRKPKDKMVISNSLMKQTEIIDEDGTDEVINMKKDPFNRSVYLACQRYPFGGVQNSKQGNVTVYDFYLGPSKVNLNLMPINMQSLYQRIIERSQVYPEDEDLSENNSTLNEGITIEDSLVDNIIGNTNIDKLDHALHMNNEEDNEVDVEEENVEQESVQDIERLQEVEHEVIDVKDEVEHEVVDVKDEVEHEVIDVKDDVEHEVADVKDEVEHEAVDVKDEVEHEAVEVEPTVAEVEPTVAEVEPTVAEVEPRMEAEEDDKVEPRMEAEEEGKVEPRMEAEEDDKVEPRMEAEEKDKVEAEEGKVEPRMEAKEGAVEPRMEAEGKDKVEAEEDDKVEPRMEAEEKDKVEAEEDDKVEPRMETEVEDKVEQGKDVEQFAEDTITVPLDFEKHDSSHELALSEITNNTTLTETPTGIYTDGIYGNGQYIYYPTGNKNFRWLDDNSHYQIVINNLHFPTLEHYYHYMKFLLGLENPKDMDLSKWGYEQIINVKKAADVKNLTNREGLLRSKMFKFSNKMWNNEKENIVFYGRINKLLQHTEIKEALLATNNIYIIKKVKNVKNIPKNKLGDVLNSAVYFDKEERKWYGGKVLDSWVTLRTMLRENKLDPENISKIFN